MKPKVYSYIRFSRPEQLKGGSMHRQLKMAETYAEKHGLTLDDSLKFRDLGMSAFKGLHRTKGALASFLQLISDGKVPKGSVLIVESLDRLSREAVLDAFDLFRDIIRAGVKIATLSDSMEYDEKIIRANPMQLMISLMVMQRAHEESETKSKRLKAAWENKRENAVTKKLTAQAPLWLKLSEDRSEFIPVKECCEAINRIFDMRLEGKGAELCARIMNNEPDVWKPNGCWRQSYITKILKNRACIGEFQPMQTIDKVRQSVGPPIKGYFPSIVSEQKFVKVQHMTMGNKFSGGRTGQVSNLFAGIATCGYCGARMRFINKGNGEKKIICDNAYWAVGDCELTRKKIKYEDFENTILDFCEALQV